MKLHHDFSHRAHLKLLGQPRWHWLFYGNIILLFSISTKIVKNVTRFISKTIKTLYSNRYFINKNYAKIYIIILLSINKKLFYFCLSYFLKCFWHILCIRVVINKNINFRTKKPKADISYFKNITWVETTY